MQVKCNRFVFKYLSLPEEVEDFIRRSADFAEQTYGRDPYFSRLNQVLDHARFLGWGLPRFGTNLPEEFSELPPAAIDHIFENQAKLLVDIAPVTQVMLESGRYCPVRMVCGTTAAGDLIWKCHLLTDRDGCPYVQRKSQKFKVKTKGTRIVCQAETLPYDEKYLFECFGGEKTAIWPVPFLPEFFSDRPVAQIFRAEADVVEVVTIQEEKPVRVLASELVPWYRNIVIDRTKALPFDDFDPEASEDQHNDTDDGEHGLDDEDEDDDDSEDESSGGVDVNTLVGGWDELADNEKIDMEELENYDDEDDDDDEDEEQSNSISFVNVSAAMSDSEYKQLQGYDDTLSKSGIASKQEAESLKQDPKHKERAENWLVTAINRLRLIANYSTKIGAIISFIQKHPGQQVLIIQPRQKWAASLVDILNQKGHKSQLFDPEKPQAQLRHFYDGGLRVMVTSTAREELFIDDLIIISVSSFDLIKWFDWLNPSHLVYSICLKQFGYTDNNCVPEHPLLQVEMQDYTGPGYDFLQLETKQEKKIEKPQEKLQEKSQETKSLNKTDPLPAVAIKKEETEKKEKYRIVTGKGRPKTVGTYEKALDLAKKQEELGKKCEIYGPEGSEALYITGIGELN